MRLLSFLLLSTAALTAQTAQSQLSTTFQGGLIGSVGNAVFFDLSAAAPVTWRGFDLSFVEPAGTAGSVSVWTRVGTAATFETGFGGWVFAETLGVTTAEAGEPTHGDFVLPPAIPVGVTGVAIVANGLTHRYTTGTATYTSCQLSLTTVSAMNAPFTLTPVFAPRTANTNIYYTSDGPDYCAAASSFGAGCHSCFASYYEFFTTPAAFDLLPLTAVTMVPTGSGYSVSYGPGAYIPPGTFGPATTLVIGDDEEVAYPLTTGTFVGCDGHAWTTLNIISNGKVSEFPGNSLVAAPAVGTMLDDLHTAFCSQGDWDPSAGGAVKVEESSTVTVVTWEAVPSWGVVGSANTFQMQFYPGGLVMIVWGAMDAGGANGGVLVGYSPGGPSMNPGPTDLSVTLLPFDLCCADVAPLTLSTTDRPLQPTSGSDPFDVTTSNIDTAAILHIGVLGLTTIYPGWPLLLPLGLGPGDCNLYCQPDAIVVHVLAGVSQLDWTALTLLPPPADFRNIHFCVQSLTLNPGWFGPADRSSNGLACVVGNQ